jgi:hypothetical protein
MTSDQEIYDWTSHNRLMIADVLASLDDGDWDAPTLCSGWTVRHLAAHLTPPMLVGPMGPFADTCIQLRDMARPLGLAADVPVEHWRTLLDYLVSPTAAPALVRAGLLSGLTLAATDADWVTGRGPGVHGPVEALAMAVAGRPAAVAGLRGPGVPTIEGRLAAP